MTLIEPDVFWSDIVLGGLCLFLAVLLRRRKSGWSHVFEALALATVIGAFYHGLINTTTEIDGKLLWSATLFWFALAAILIIDGCFKPSPRTRVLLGSVLLGYMGFAVFVSDKFLWVLILQAIAILILAVRYVTTLRKTVAINTRHRQDLLLTGFLACNTVAIVLQQTKVTFGLPISHNTVFHILELPVMVLLYLFLKHVAIHGTPRRS